MPNAPKRPRGKSATNAYIERACANGDGPRLLGTPAIATRKASIWPSIPSVAASSISKACELQYGGGCFNSAVVLENGIGGSKDLEQALAYYQKGCGLEHLTSCFWAAWFPRRRGKAGQPADPETARDLFDDYCEL